MPTELEAKLKVEDHESVRAALVSAGAMHVGRVFERNYILDLPGGTLRARGAALRVRACQTLDGPPQRETLTFKGPARASRFKAREEIEVEVGSAEATVGILTTCGFTIVLLYEKRRETWRLDDCRVELDELPVLGLYVEIEGPSESAIANVGNRLGLGGRSHEPASYVAMLSQYCANRELGDWEVRFDV